MHDRALGRLLLAPAPSVAALAAKLRLACRDLAWELPSGDALMEALERDALSFARPARPEPPGVSLKFGRAAGEGG